ncbi:hypothetical protein ACIOTN_16990 [Glutamicibacter sp. NPDC087661]|uniref:hypothetical protein n=1 Tax=Glutamicibacter sp. NPDC087661 TaxID=3363996 RepID=UPI003821FC23
MSRYSDNYDQAAMLYRTARNDAIEANELVGSAAVDVAEQILDTGTADATVLAVYKKAKELAAQKSAVMHDAWGVYDQSYRIWTGQEKVMPPAGATAEGDETKHSNGK